MALVSAVSSCPSTDLQMTKPILKIQWFAARCHDTYTKLCTSGVEEYVHHRRRASRRLSTSLAIVDTNVGFCVELGRAVGVIGSVHTDSGSIPHVHE